jgi:hypothetical protein
MVDSLTARQAASAVQFYSAADIEEAICLQRKAFIDDGPPPARLRKTESTGCRR